MKFERLTGYTVTSDQMRKWLLGGHTNADPNREQEIADMFKGLTWVRKDAGDNQGSITYLDISQIDPEYPYYWGTAHGDKTWQVYMEAPSMGTEDVEKWVMREIDGNAADGSRVPWSLGIYPALITYTCINWETENIMATCGVYHIPGGFSGYSQKPLKPPQDIFEK